MQPESAVTFSPAALANEIRAAVGRGASGLMVEPMDDPAVVDALYEAVDQGMAVLLLDRQVATRGGKSIPFIRYGAIPESGRRIVNGTLEAAKLFHGTESGRIVVLHHISIDPYADERLKSLTDPLEAAGKSFSMVEFAGDANQGVDLLKKSLAAGPKVDMVFADDDAGIKAAQHVLAERVQSNQPTFLFSGFLGYDIRIATDVVRQATVYGDKSVETFGIKAFQTAQNLMDGKPVGEIIDVPIPVYKKPILFVPTPPDSEKAPSAAK